MTKKPTTQAAPDLMKRANFFMPQPMLDGLNKLAERPARKPLKAAEHVRRAVGQYLRRHGIEA